MTASNHVVTGVLVASTIHIPIIALPVALISHFVLDSLPHYSEPGLDYGSPKFKTILAIDIYVALMCLGLLLLLSPPSLWLLLFAGIIAASPDLMWFPDFKAALQGEPKPVYGPIRRFHSRIQRFANPSGLWVEVAWFVIVFIAAFGFTIAG